MRKLVAVACAVALSWASAAEVNVVKWYGALYTTPDLLRAAVPGLTFTRGESGWTVTYQGRTLTMTDGSTTGALNGNRINVGSPPRVIEGVAYVPLDDIVSTFGIVGVQGKLTAVLAKSDPLPAPAAAPAPTRTTATTVTTTRQVAAAPTQAKSPYVDGVFVTENYERNLLNESYWGSATTTRVQTEFADRPDNVIAFCRGLIKSLILTPETARFSLEGLGVYGASTWFMSGKMTYLNLSAVPLTRNYVCAFKRNGPFLSSYWRFLD